MNRKRLQNTNAFASIRQQPHHLVVNWEDGHTSQFHWIWLRDNAPEARHPNGQKLIETVSIPLDISPSRVTAENGRIAVTWPQDGTQSLFEPAWLRRHCCCPEDRARRRNRPQLWDAGLMETGLPWGSYHEIANSQSALKDWLRNVEAHGFALLKGVPVEAGTIFEVVSLFGFVRETNYGRLYDVRVDPDPINLADTNLGLSAHTDNPYRDPVQTLQLLHCLTNDAEGGESSLVDGFNVAETLRKEHAEAFKLLTTIPVRFRFSSGKADLAAEHPFIELDARGEVAAIRFNNRSVQPFDCPPEQMAAFYHAHRTLSSLLEAPRFSITFKLRAGDLMIFDNVRVLHGRKAFTAAGARHLQGCYADRDGLLSTLRVLERHPRDGEAA